MKVLLDTHVWRWYLLGDNKLSRAERRIIEDETTDLVLSSMSIWEAHLLIEKNRQPVDEPPGVWIKNALRILQVREAGVTFVIALGSRSLAGAHQDPADHFIAATAIEISEEDTSGENECERQTHDNYSHYRRAKTGGMAGGVNNRRAPHQFWCSVVEPNHYADPLGGNSMPVKREYSAGKFMLELEGAAAGFLQAVAGGEPYASVISEAVGEGEMVRKHLGPVAYEPIRLSFGAGMGAPLFAWMSEWLTGQQPIHSGAVVFLDYNFKELSRLEFDSAMITEIVFPGLDAASKDNAYLSLSLQPGQTRFSKASSGAIIPSFGGKIKQLMLSNFRVKIGDLPTKRISKIDAMTVKQTISQGEARGLQVPDLVLTLLEIDANQWFDWFDDFAIKGDTGEKRERGGAIDFLSPDLKTVIFTLNFSNLGIFRISRERHETGAEVVAKVRVELYCEQIAFSGVRDAAGAPARALSAVPSSASAGAVLLAQALLAALADPVAGSGAKESGPAEAERIARRLQASKRTMDATDPLPPKRDEGAALGTRWAAETATLDELKEIAALEPRQWGAIRLTGQHSLMKALLEAGVIPSGGDGSLDLERDSFVEGIVAGALEVLRKATPHLQD